MLRLALLPALSAGCAARSAPSAPPIPQPFVGTVVYDVAVGGTDEEMIALSRTFGPAREAAAWGSGGRLRVETTSGSFAGLIVARLPEEEIYALDAEKREAIPARVESLNEADVAPEMLAWFQQNFGPAEVERTGERGTYAGRTCQVYALVRSAMLRPGAAARACIAEDLLPPPTRYRFSWGAAGQSMAPMPLQYGIREGLPLWVEVTEGGVTVTWTASEVTAGEPDPSLFAVPDGYTIRAAE